MHLILNAIFKFITSYFGHTMFKIQIMKDANHSWIFLHTCTKNGMMHFAIFVENCDSGSQIHRIGCFAFNFKSRRCVFKMTLIQTCQNDSILCVNSFALVIFGNSMCEASYKMLGYTKSTCS